MSDIKISDMQPWTGAVTGNVEIPGVFGNENYRIALSQMTPSSFGFGSMALQNSNAVSITGGSVAASTIDGVVSILNGGTGATTAAGARVNLLPSYAGNGGRVLALNAGATDVQWLALGGIGTVTSVNVSGGTTGLTFSGGPITAAGTMTMAGTLATTNGGTGSTTTFTAGSVVFAGASGVYSQSNAQLFWDSANNRLGVGTNTPATKFSVAGTSTLGTTIGDTAITTDQMGYEYATDTLPTILPTLNLDFINSNAVDPRVTFTRSTTGTYYDGKTNAKAEENLFLYSQRIGDAAAWTVNATSASINSSTAPDGTFTATTLTADGTSNIHRVGQGFTGTTLTQTFSFYAKAGTNNFVQIYLANDSEAYANFNVTTGAGVVGTKGTSVSVSSIVDVGLGWYRCAAVITTSASANAFYIVVTSSASAVRAETNSLSTNVILWGAQLEQRSVPTGYIATTTAGITNYIPQLLTAAINQPRLDFTPTTRAPRGLLIEEQRTNLMLRSDDFTNASWSKSLTTVLGDATVSPDGTVNADKLISNFGAGNYTVAQNRGVTNGVTYTVSVYLKAAEVGFAIVYLFGPGFGANAAAISVNLSTGAVSTATGSPQTAQSFNVGNGWWRVSFSRAAVATSTGQVIIFLSNDGIWANTANSVPVGTGYYIWGAQFESGAFPTSYIPTTSTTVLRGDDYASLTGSNFTSWFNLSEGTYIYEYNRVANTTSSAGRVISSGVGGSNSFGLWINQATGTQDQITIRDNLVDSVSALFNVNSSGTSKGAVGYKVNDFAWSSNGATPATDSSGPVPSQSDQLRLGRAINTDASFLNGHIRHVTYYPIRLSNTILQGMTK